MSTKINTKWKAIAPPEKGRPLFSIVGPTLVRDLNDTIPVAPYGYWNGEETIIWFTKTGFGIFTGEDQIERWDNCIPVDGTISVEIEE